MLICIYFNPFYKLFIEYASLATFVAVTFLLLQLSEGFCLFVCFFYEVLSVLCVCMCVISPIVHIWKVFSYLKIC